MSATGRGRQRIELDAYDSPTWIVRAILPFLQEPPKQNILEPACGAGAIVFELHRSFPRANIVPVDVAPRDDMASHAFIGDFLDMQPYPCFDLIITNPPYSLAQEFVEQAMLWRRNESSTVAMLLRLNFLGSQKRAAWLRANTPSVYVSPRRPSFDGNGTDATEYAFFVWNDKPPTVVILPTEKP